MDRRRYPLSFLLCLLMVAGCMAHRPAELLEPLPSAETLRRAPERYQDRSFAFGGEIISLLQTDDEALVEVELVELGRGGRIRTPIRPLGRVFLRSVAELPAERYLPGRGLVGVARFSNVGRSEVDGRVVTYPFLDLGDHKLVRRLATGTSPRFHIGVGIGFGL